MKATFLERPDRIELLFAEQQENGRVRVIAHWSGTPAELLAALKTDPDTDKIYVRSDPDANS